MSTSRLLKQIGEKLDRVDWLGMTWQYEDPKAKIELTRRIALVGVREGLISYSDLVKGVEFRIPNVYNGDAYTIDVTEWTGIGRAVIGSFLGAISAESYVRARFLASALIINQVEVRPSDHFFEWMKDLNVLPNLKEATVDEFWQDQVKRAHAWYTRPSGGAT